MPTVTNEFEIDAPRRNVWDFFLTPERVAPCVPGCEEVERLSDVEFNVIVALKVAYADLTFDTHIEITEQVSPDSLTVEGEAEPAGRMPGSALVSGNLELEDDDEDRTLGILTVDFGIRGRLGSLGESAFRHKCEEVTQQFIDNVKNSLGGRTVDETV